MAAISVLHILRTIREHGPISRTALQQMTSLSWGTITNATRDLLQRHLIREESVPTTRAGRKPVHLSLNRADHCMIGLELGAEAMRCIAINLAGETLAYEEAAGIGGIGAEGVGGALDRAGGMIQRALAGQAGRMCMGIGVAVPGALDETHSVMQGTPQLPGWKNAAIRSELEKRVGAAIRAERDMNCLALVERWFGVAAHAQDVLAVHVGETVGMGILLNGEIFQGSQGMAGEFGHMTLDPEGPMCACGDKGCVETFCSVGGIIGKNVGGGGGGVWEEFVKRAKAGDGAARAALEQMGKHLGVAIANAVDLFDPEQVVVVGKLTALWEYFSPALLVEMAAHAWQASSRNVAVSTLGAPGAAMGACAMILEAALSSDENGAKNNKGNNKNNGAHPASRVPPRIKSPAE